MVPLIKRFGLGLEIGGQYYQTKEFGKEVRKRWTGASSVPEMPWYIELIFWSQFSLFSVFGLVCTWQVIEALTMKVNKNTYAESEASGVTNSLTGMAMTEDELIAMQFNKRVAKTWLRYSLCYSILSITAKTILELGFFFLVLNWKPWDDDVVSDAVVSK